jgi:uncharacterized protein with FMN-binding domain
MRLKKWRGTMLFAVILTTMGLTNGLKLYGAADMVGTTASGTTTSAGVGLPSTPQPTTAPAPAAPSAAAPAPAAAAPAPAPSAAPAGVTTTIDGQVEQTPYGPIQVSVTFVDRTITAVTELQAPNDQGRSVAINQQAAPILEQEVLSAQSANIDTVSGATYTSEGYAQSVQSAIDQL